MYCNVDIVHSVMVSSLFNSPRQSKEVSSMVYSVPKPSKSVFDEVAIADFGPFQIAVLTNTTLVNKPIFSAQVTVPQRQYQSQGWLIYDGRVMTALEGLTLGSVFSEDSPFKPIQRMAPALPVSFEVQSSQPLPTQVSTQASFTCELQDTDFPFHNIFRQICPRFVRVYPFGKTTALSTTLSAQVKQLLADEALFIKNNYARLKQIPFYKTHFEL